MVYHITELYTSEYSLESTSEIYDNDKCGFFDGIIGLPATKITFQLGSPTSIW